MGRDPRGEWDLPIFRPKMGRARRSVEAAQGLTMRRAIFQRLARGVSGSPHTSSRTGRARCDVRLPPGLARRCVVKQILPELAKDPAAVLDLANGSAVRAKYDAETETARSLGIFGSPTFVIGSEIFWGDDRLEDALDWSLRGSSY